MKSYVINPVEMRLASLEKPETLALDVTVPEDVAVVEGFLSMDDDALAQMIGEMGFAMDKDDLQFCRAYFKDTEKRDPTVTELRMIDTYWSDHCRHTTFGTKIKEVTIPDGAYSTCIKDTYKSYLETKTSSIRMGAIRR